MNGDEDAEEGCVFSTEIIAAGHEERIHHFGQLPRASEDKRYVEGGQRVYFNRISKALTFPSFHFDQFQRDVPHHAIIHIGNLNTFTTKPRITDSAIIFKP